MGKSSERIFSYFNSAFLQKAEEARFLLTLREGHPLFLRLEADDDLRLLDVELDRALQNEELLSDLLVCLAEGEEDEHLPLAAAQPRSVGGRRIVALEFLKKGVAHTRGKGILPRRAPAPHPCSPRRLVSCNIRFA